MRCRALSKSHPCLNGRAAFELYDKRIKRSTPPRKIRGGVLRLWKIEKENGVSEFPLRPRRGAVR